MNINDIKDSTKFVILTTDTYCESTGWEKDGELGSMREFIRTHPFDTIEKVQDWVIANPNKNFKLFAVTPMTATRTISIKVDVKNA